MSNDRGKWVAIYECRLCGEEVHGPSHDWKPNIIMELQCLVVPELPPQHFELSEIGIHECEDGGIGVSDLRGFAPILDN